MSIADEIRAYCIANLVRPARERGQLTVTIRAGDVHRGLGYLRRLPAVCAALGSERFEREAGVRRIAVDGPLNGSRTLFVFRFLE